MKDSVRAMPEPAESTEAYWRAVLERNGDFDGRFVYAVHSTGIYCRPSCPSRKPKVENVSFFALPELARDAGFRPCRRCRPERGQSGDPRLEAVRRACRSIDANPAETPTLAQLSREAGISPSHFQRLFKRVVGVSPQAYAESRRMTRVREALGQGDDIGGALYEAGFGSSSGLYSRAATELGMTPGDYKRGGRGVRIHFTTRPCFLGELLVAATERGICAVRIGDSANALESELAAEFHQAVLERDDGTLADAVAAILEHLEGRRPHLDLPFDVKATAFQKRVWQALQEIPYGETRSYAQVAAAIGKPKAVRAVASACARNPVALAVPCHRVLRSDGSMGGYRWGVERKQALLRKERETAPQRGED